MSVFRVPVEEFTTPNPITANEDTGIEELQRMMSENGIRHLPIMRGKKVIGILSDRDIRVAVGLALPQKLRIHASDIMARDPVTVTSDMYLDEVAFKMSEMKIGSVLVNDENDEFMGIFTVTDALNALIEISRQ